MIIDTDSTVALTDITGLILIDCWEPPSWKSGNIDIYNKLINRLEKFSFREVINASAMLAYDIKDPSIYNTYDTYLWNNLHDFNNNQLILNALANHRGEYRTFPGIRDTVLRTSNSFYITHHDDFINHWERNGKMKITNWLVVGQEWQNCAHNNSIGLKTLASLSVDYNLKFFGLIGGFITSDQQAVEHSHYEQDYLNWIQCSNGLYQLVAEYK